MSRSSRATPPYRSKRSFQTVAGTVSSVFINGGTGAAHGYRTLAFAGASSDSSHMLFLANDALTGASEGRPAAEGGAGGTYEKENNLYDSVDGQLQLVNVLPNGTTHADATFGGGASAGLNGVKFSHVISNDGSRIFWTDLTTGHIYVRENGTSTVEISPDGKYQTASSNGSVVFYTNGDLYEYELEGAKTTDLTPGVQVEKVIGASEDGKYVYYETTSGEFKLWHDGTTTTIMATKISRGEVTPDGHSVVFSYEPTERFPKNPVTSLRRRHWHRLLRVVYFGRHDRCPSDEQRGQRVSASVDLSRRQSRVLCQCGRACAAGHRWDV